MERCHNFQPISFYFHGELRIKSVFIMKITICLYIISCYKHKLQHQTGEVLFIETDFAFTCHSQDFRGKVKWKRLSV